MGARFSSAAWLFLGLFLAQAAHAEDTAANSPVKKDLDAGAARGSSADGVVSVEAAPRAAQIEPIIVAPVKREMPKTPELKGAKSLSVPKPNSSKSEPSSKKANIRARGKIVGDRPNCDAGFKVDDSGKSCVRIAESAGARKRKGR